jgi:hypothetical protein
MPETKPQSIATDELGSTGLKRSGQRGLIYEEFLPQLQDERARKVFREMRDNDPTVGAVLYAIEMLIRQAEWRVEGEDEDLVEFVESCLTDMSTSWEDFLAEVLSMLVYGWSWHEVVYKRRLGPDQKDPSKRSQYNDGKIGWRKFPIRSQDSLSEWIFDDEGGVQAMQQMAPPDYKIVEIPIERSLLFRTGLHKGNPEGRSILRSAYRPWLFKKRIEEIEGIGVERDLAGMPVIYRDGTIAAAYDDELKKILRNVRRDEQEGVLLPLAYDENGNKLLTFELLSAAGSRQLDTDKIINRYDKRIAMVVLADFILLGQQAVGSFALADNKTAMFAVAIGTILKGIASVFNLYAIPRLIAVNGLVPKEPKDMPKLVPGDIESPDLGQLGAYITALAGAGAPLFPDADLEDHLRKIGDLPLRSEEAKALPPVSQPPAKAPKTPPSVGEIAPPAARPVKAPKTTLVQPKTPPGAETKAKV